MADEQTNVAQPQEPAKPEPQAPSKEVKDFVGGKYKTPEELEKAYQDLEKKLGEQGNELSKSREFVQTIQPLLETIRDDEELFKVVDQKLREKVDGKKSETKSEPKADVDVRNVTQDILLARFEEKHGIDKLDTEKQKKLRNDIGAIVFKHTGQSINEVDLRRLNDILEDAYFLANKEELLNRSKLEALAAAQGTEEATIGSIPSATGKAEQTLTPEEAKVAAKMGLTREQYLEGKKQASR